MEFTKLSEVEALTEVPENATVLAEVDGVIKRIPGDGLGGGAGIATAIIKSSDYDEALGMLQSGGATPTIADAGPTYSCINMTFNEAYSLMAAGEPLDVIFMFSMEGCMVARGLAMFGGTAMTGCPCICLTSFGILGGYPVDFVTLFWTEEGLSTEMPSVNE